MTTDREERCERCRGDGYYWRVPDGFNPFYAGAMMTASVSEKVRCWVCRGTGRAALAGKDKAPDGD